MKCPECGRTVEPHVTHCPNCGQELPQRESGRSVLRRILVMTVCWILALAVFALGVYKLYYWIDAYRFDRKYTRGAYAPSVTETTLDDGRAAHAIAFYGNDGDKVFLEELNQVIEVSGGVARIEIADSDWFGSDIESMESADVHIASMLIYQNGDKRRLPEIDFTVEAPESPIEVISPAQEDIAVNTSIYSLKVQVVPGSKVNVNGKDVTDIVDRSGLLSVNVNVFPIGDNVYSIVVDTANHKEARKDVVIYRQKMEIAVEIDNTVPTSTNSSTVTVTGKVDLGATISVDTDYVEGSISQDPVTGAYAFVAKMTNIGTNPIRFRAVQDGKADSVLTINVDYLPSLNEYANLAWAMDYKALCGMFEEWQGQPFVCKGKAIDVYEENGVQYIIMDVGPEGTEQLLVLENYSKLDTPQIGQNYTAYADVNGRYMYKANYHPLLKIRYMYEGIVN